MGSLFNYFQKKVLVFHEYLILVFRHKNLPKVSFFGLCSKMQIIPIKNLNIKKVVLQFLRFFRLKCWFKGQTISRIHLSLPNAYILMCFDRNINGNRDVKFLVWLFACATVHETHFTRNYGLKKSLIIFGQNLEVPAVVVHSVEDKNSWWQSHRGNC